MIRLSKEQVIALHKRLIEVTGGCDGKEGFVCACYEGIYQFVAVSKIIEDRLKHKKGK